MANMVSPGTSVPLTDESFFIPSQAALTPLFFIATAAEKKQIDGITAAAGTYESNTIRTVTSIKQSLSLYGLPRFIEDINGNAYHGDARNEYGLFALNQFLGVGSRAYVVRANVNLNDDLDHLRSLWVNHTTDAAALLQTLVSTSIAEYNASNGYSPSSGTSGYQEIHTTTSPLISGTPTGLVGETTYGATITIDGIDHAISILGSDAQTYGALFSQINAQLGASGVVGLSATAGNLRITSATVGTSSSVLIEDALTDPLFASLTNFSSIVAAVAGTSLYKRTVTASELHSLAVQATADVWKISSFSTLQTDFFDLHATGVVPCPYPIYANGYSSAQTGCFGGFDGATAAWVDANSGSVVVGQFTPVEASNLFLDVADEFQFTLQFLNETSLGANDSDRRTRIVTALKAIIASNQDIRSEQYEYNLIVCPGFFETAVDMVALAVDIKEEALVIGDTPFTKDPADVVTWGATTARVKNRNIAYYYPHGLATNLDGKTVFVAASGTIVRQIAYNDSVSACWWAPAGTRRGVITGLSDVGYLTGTLGTATTFNAVALNQGQRDDLYKYFTNINPIVFFPERGIVVWGQKTSAPDASALDRVNVVRMLMYVRRSLRKNTLSFVFEPNDQPTRDNLKAAVDGFLGDIMSRRGIMDFATVCNESNNGPTVVDNNQMYCDVAIKPMKAAEFIIIPIRVVSSGAAL